MQHTNDFIILCSIWFEANITLILELQLMSQPDSLLLPKYSLFWSTLQKFITSSSSSGNFHIKIITTITTNIDVILPPPSFLPCSLPLWYANNISLISLELLKGQTYRPFSAYLHRWAFSNFYYQKSLQKFLPCCKCFMTELVPPDFWCALFLPSQEML